MAAVASVTVNMEREMWNIMEASSGAETGDTKETKYDYEDTVDDCRQTPTPPPRHRRKSAITTEAAIERCNSPGSYDNYNFSNSSDDADCYDEVFLPNNQVKDIKQENGLQYAELACSIRDKLRSDNVDYETHKRSSEIMLSDSTQSDNELQQYCNRTPPPKPPRLHHQHQRLAETLEADLSKSTNNLINATACKTIYVIENQKKSPAHKPRFKKQNSQQHSSSNSNSKSNRHMRRSCSCNSDSSASSPSRDISIQSQPTALNNAKAYAGFNNWGASWNDISKPVGNNNNNSHTANNLNFYTLKQQQRPLTQQTEKFSPLKAVSNFIFPPIVKHSSLFHLFQPCPTVTADIACGNGKQIPAMVTNSQASQKNNKDFSLTSKTAKDNSINIEAEESTSTVSTEIGAIEAAAATENTTRSSLVDGTKS